MSNQTEHDRMSDLDEDAPLVDRSLMGDADAFAELVSRHQKRIHNLAYRMSHSADEAADLAQETFVRAWQQLDTFRADARFSTWLYRLAIRVCLNAGRAAASRNKARETFGRECLLEDSVHNLIPESDRTERVQSALQRLEPPLRAAIVLTVYDGLDHAEAARMLGCAETTISWRLFMARRKLRHWLKELDTGRKGP